MNISRRKLMTYGLATAAGAGTAWLIWARQSGDSGWPWVSAVNDPPREGAPNIVLIMADDLGVDHVGCYGGSVKTPNLDAMAARGFQFTNCFTSPICTVTRVMLMTGRYPFRTGWNKLIFRMDQDYLDPKAETTFANMLSDHGYRTAVTGKWQLGYMGAYPDHPRDLGFNQSLLWSWIPTKGAEVERVYYHPGIMEDGTPISTNPEDYGPRMFTDYAVQFIRNNRRRPFFIYYPMYLPHRPWHVPPSKENEFWDRFRVRQEPKLRHERFLEMVEYMDYCVGRIMNEIDNSGLAENTIVIFTADNGTVKNFLPQPGSKYPKKVGKGSLHDSGTHVPFILQMPNAASAGRGIHELIDHTDVLPTLAEWTGASLPEDVLIDGKSFAPLLEPDGAPIRDWVYIQYYSQSFIRTLEWKLKNNGEMYDLRKDPLEEYPIFPKSDNMHAQRVRRALAGCGISG